MTILPTTLSLGLIGRVVSIQAFLYTYDEAGQKDGQIDLDSMKKWVGTLEFFSLEDDLLTIRLHGAPHLLFIDRSARHYEVFTLAEK